ncbi:MAG: sigma factor [Roseitalea porphyridii]|uniref:RNA polymerase sigma factor n=1 Tax=Roseitalea porphyridii TaxID=1852022 RepID=UPI0032EEA21D
MTQQGQTARRAAERAARLSYGRLIAFLAARTGDVAGAEDALGDALVAALKAWPASGVPDRPEAWLLTVARRRILDRQRSQTTAEAHRAHLVLLDEERQAMRAQTGFPDERLKLMFVCAHPAIDEKARTPLMLQLVLGLDVARMASAFVMAPATLGQRLVRAKAKIKDAGIGFAVPEPAVFRERMGSVLDAVYAAYTVGWDGAHGEDAKAAALAAEAVWLGRLIVHLVPDDPEASGLLALMLLCESRRAARRDPETGAFIAIAEQDVAMWDDGMADEAESLLRRAGEAERPGRYQLEAAIQAVHADRRRSGSIRWDEIVLLYRGLVALSPTAGALCGLAAALAEKGDVEGAHALLSDAAIPNRERYQPYWATRAHIEALGGDRQAAIESYRRAASLSTDPAVRTHLDVRRIALADG